MIFIVGRSMTHPDRPWLGSPQPHVNLDKTRTYADEDSLKSRRDLELEEPCLLVFAVN